MKKSRRFDARNARSDSSIPSFDSSEHAGHRQARLEHILCAELQSLLRDEATDPALQGIQLVSLTLSPDGGHARIGYAVIGALEQEQQVKARTQQALERATGFLRARLASQLDLKRLPKLTFTFVGIVEPASEEGGGEWPA